MIAEFEEGDENASHILTRHSLQPHSADGRALAVEHHREAAAPRALQPGVERPRAPRRRLEEAIEGGAVAQLGLKLALQFGCVGRAASQVSLEAGIIRQVLSVQPTVAKRSQHSHCGVKRNKKKKV